MAKKVKKIKRLTDQMRGKLILVFIGIICLFFILAVRLTYWTVNKGSEFETKVLGQQKHDSSVIPFERGKIYDRNGNILATNEKIYTLVLEPKNILLRKKKYEATTINALHEYFGFSKKNLKKVIEGNKDSYYVVYKKNMTYDEVAKFQKFLDMADDSTKGVSDAKKEKIESARQVKGISFEEDYKRIYPYNSLACRILGFTSSGNVGNWGIEQSYNEQLNGVNGRAYYYFNEELDQEQTVKEAKNGNSVVSTIDMQIQKIIEEKLNDFDSKIGSKVTNILVMNPQNGEILGMASSNPYDLNEPMDEKKLLSLYSQSEIDEMKAYTQEKEAEEASEEESGEESSEETTEQEDKDTEKKKTIYDAFYELWRNAIISDTNEPGSTYKPFTVAAGLEEGILKGNETFYCDGYQKVGPHTIHCSHRNGHGLITLSQSISLSCNDALMQIAEKEGKNVFAKYQRNFNFGKKTGIDLPGEAQTASLLHDAKDMTAADLATSSFGQSFNCSMIQMASAFSSLINGGYYYKPHVVKQLRSSSGEVVSNIEPTMVKQTVSKETSDKLKKYMKETVESGTGTKAKMKDYSAGGKTGTAQKIPRSAGTYIVSFCGFAPAENPQVLVYVVIDEIQKESQTNTGLAVEVAKNVLKGSLKELNVPKSNKK